MKDPESFSVYGTCYYCVVNEDSVDTQYIFIPYRAANSYGAYGTDVGMFINNYFFASYDEDESDYSIGGNKTASERANSLQFYRAQLAYLKALKGDYEKSYTVDEVKAGLNRWYK